MLQRSQEAVYKYVRLIVMLRFPTFRRIVSPVLFLCGYGYVGASHASGSIEYEVLFIVMKDLGEGSEEWVKIEHTAFFIILLMSH